MRFLELGAELLGEELFDGGEELLDPGEVEEVLVDCLSKSIVSIYTQCVPLASISSLQQRPITRSPA